MTRVFGDCHGRLGRDNVEILTSEWEIHGNPTVQPHPLHNFDRSLGPRLGGSWNAVDESKKLRRTATLCEYCKPGIPALIASAACLAQPIRRTLVNWM